MIDFRSEFFLNLVHSAQDGCVNSRNLVVVFSVPVVWSLRPTADEAQDLFVHLIEYVIPRWNGVTDWALHCTVCCTSKLLTIRRTENRYRFKGTGL